MAKALAAKKDFTSGKVLKNLILFALPMAAATFLQMLFNAADVAIVGQFSGVNGPQYQAAVGATSSTVHLIVNLFIGISVGVNVAMANAYGAKDEERQRRVVHTSMALSIVSGLLVLLVGLFLSRPILKVIKTPDTIIDYSVIYMQVYFVGAPALMVYNFGASLMRGVGETRKPLYYLLVSGILNVIINVITVVFLGWHVVGVALGTTISQYVAAVWLVIDLTKAKDSSKYILKQTRFYGKELKKIIFIGVPMGLSSCFFSLSNLSVQSSINAYGDMAIAGNTVGSNIGTLGDALFSSIEKSVVTFVGQNVGAKKERRVHRIIGAGATVSTICGVVYGALLLLAGESICGIYNSNTEVIDWAMRRLVVVEAWYILVTLMHMYGGALRGMGYSMFPMIINLVFTCIVRIVYVLFVYANFENQQIEQIYIIYPITWLLSGVLQMLAYYVLGYRAGHFKRKPTEKNSATENPVEETPVDAE